jgi:hypothetical protein
MYGLQVRRWLWGAELLRGCADARETSGMRAVYGQRCGYVRVPGRRGSPSFFAQLGLLRGRVVTAGATASALGISLPRASHAWRPRTAEVETLFYSKGDGCVHHRPSAASCTTWKNFGRGFKEGIPRTAFCPKNMPAHALPWTHCVLFRGCEYFPPYSRSLY